MDAVRIIAASRRGLAEANTVQGVIAEAWQAQALAEAIGSHLAIFGPYEVRSRARGLGDAGGRFSGDCCARRRSPVGCGRFSCPKCGTSKRL